ncbi:MAG TPA: prepilin-type N-terminal cleavage/methylation domain-containing protein [Nitrospirota bacterium]|nr:prepilin-type N-terminal cleavage/methylation domain-containing protein [Nitrospirota bacterium]
MSMKTHTRKKTDNDRRSGRGGGLRSLVSSSAGFSLVELLFVLVIFSLVMAALYQSFNAQVKMGIMREYRVAESEMELGIVRGIIERDLAMTGYALSDNVDSASGLSLVAPLNGTDGGAGAPDTLLLRGTAVGRGTRAAQGWTYAEDQSPTFFVWDDARENLVPGSTVIIMDPTIKRLKSMGTDWMFRYTGPNTSPTTLGGSPFNTGLQQGDVIYGFYGDPSAATPVQPYYSVRYSLGGTSPGGCAQGTLSLLRVESRTDALPVGGDPIMNCVLDMEVVLGRDTNEDSIIDQWDNGAAAFTTGAATAEAALVMDPSSDLMRNLNRSLKQIRMYILVQDGSREQNYTYSNPDPAASNPAVIRVGDLSLPGGAAGRDVTLTAEQRRYRWRVVMVTESPRNIE